MDRIYTRDSNSAGAPLPRIPRRAPPSSRLHSAVGSPSNTMAATALQNLFITPSQTTFVIQPPTPPSASLESMPSESKSHTQDEPASSSSCSESSYVQMSDSKSRRVRAIPKHIGGVCPPEQSTPTPALFKANAKLDDTRLAWPSREDSGEVESETAREDDTPRASSSQKPASFKKTSNLRLDLSELHTPSAGPSSESLAAATSPPSRAESVTVGQLARKKSGEPLKSSLKSRRPVVRGDLSVVTAALTSKSEPNTPTHIKSVHFDAKLEHVKLFLAEQKPLAISREGSPTDDTSGTDSDFPSFIYGGMSDEERIRKSLAIDVTNLPPRIFEENDVALESLTLAVDGGSVNGRIRVRNIAFEKWIAVRFTFDWWQTTSEVTAKYIESLPGGIFDRFGFSIRLNDMLKRIEEKTLFLAVRYSVVGREIWDSNNGQNYEVKFRRQKLVLAPSPQLVAQRPSNENDSATGKTTELRDLKTRLEQVVVQKERRMLSRRTASESDNFTLKSGLPLSSRYDFSASLKSPWKGGSPFSDDRSKANTYTHMPRRSSANQKTLESKFNTRGSPRIVDSRDSSPVPFYGGSDLEDTPVPQAILSRRNNSRNHQRGYFDLGMGSSGSAVKRTPPGTPRMESVFRYNSFPPTDGSASMRSSRVVSPARNGMLSPSWPIGLGGSEESTPSITSNEGSSQNSSRNTSPMPSPVEGPMHADDGPVESNNYNVFLNRFCFYTGSDSMLDVPIDALHRSHSASSVEELLFAPSPPHYLSPAHTPTRSSSFDDVAGMSGSSTPTGHSIFGSPSPAPVAFVH
ncbi:unnamed protein product [Somion occarium]